MSELGKETPEDGLGASLTTATSLLNYKSKQKYIIDVYME